MMKNHKLVALAHPDYEALRLDKVSEEDLPEMMEKNRKELNLQVGAYENITRIEIRTEEFIKTPKKSIKRYLLLRKKRELTT